MSLLCFSVRMSRILLVKPHCFSMLSHSAFSNMYAVTLPSNVSSTQLKKEILRIKLLVLLSIYTIYNAPDLSISMDNLRRHFLQ